MIYEPSVLAVAVFAAFVAFTLGLSFYLGRGAGSAAGYFAAHGQIPWFVNGIAFAGDYLSAASFLGICGMIAAYGYDGFLYSIGYLAGWIVALFVIAEPMKRLGRFTFADALDAKFNSRGIRIAAGVSTLVVSIFYLIPQMVGAGAPVRPLLGLEHWVGVSLVGGVVIAIVVTAGMVSTTWVQFLKGSLLVVFSFVLVVFVLMRGLDVREDRFEAIGPLQLSEEATPERIAAAVGRDLYRPAEADGWPEGSPYVRFAKTQQSDVQETAADAAGYDIFRVESTGGETYLRESQVLTDAGGKIMVGGLPLGAGPGEGQLVAVGGVEQLPEEYAGREGTGPLGPVEYLSVFRRSRLTLWGSEKIEHNGGESVVYYQKPTEGADLLRPGKLPQFSGIRGGGWTDRINFVSLMLALFCGTASLPHILIRYYTVDSPAAARRSTIVGITAIGFFYILTLYLGLGAMTGGTIDLTDSNMAAPLLARSVSPTLFAAISAIAFTTVLGTVSGLILASSGAVAHDLLAGSMGFRFSETAQVRVAKIAAVVVGLIAVGLGIVFQNMNVNYLVGWAFSIAASANLPALLMLLFWRGTTAAGVVAGVTVGMVSSLGWILLSADTFDKIYGWDPATSPVPFSQPGIVTIPLALVTLIVVSLLTRPRAAAIAS